MFKSRNLRTGVPGAPWREQAHSDRGTNTQKRCLPQACAKQHCDWGGTGLQSGVSKLDTHNGVEGVSKLDFTSTAWSHLGVSKLTATRQEA